MTTLDDLKTRFGDSNVTAETRVIGGMAVLTITVNTGSTYNNVLLQVLGFTHVELLNPIRVYQRVIQMDAQSLMFFVDLPPEQLKNNAAKQTISVCLFCGGDIITPHGKLYGDCQQCGV